MNIIYRKANREDSVRLAELDSIAGAGAIEYLFHDLVPNMSPIDVVASNFYKDNYPHTYRNAIVAAYRGHVIGMGLSFPGACHKITDDMLAFFPQDRIEHFRDFFSAPVDGDYFLDALSVEAKYRRMGIGKQLLALTVQKAVEENYYSMSLLVWKDNVNAIRFYKKEGFKIIRPIKLRYHALMPHKGGCLLMRKTI